MNTLNIKYKDGFKIEENTRLYPINSNIKDRIGILVEHRRLNGSNRYLRYAIQNISGKHYFFDVRNSVIEKTKETEYNTYICPYCGERMFIVSSFERNGSVIPIHLKHYKKTNQECIFRNDSKSIILKEDYYKSEEFIRREILEYVCKKSEEGFRLNVPTSYKLYKNMKTHDVRAEVQKEIVDIVKSKQLYNINYNNKDNSDIILYTQDNREIYCYISVYKSINTAQYFEKWKKINKTVIEIKKTEIMDTHLSEYKLNRDLLITYLYDPILDKARRHKISESQKIVDELNNVNSIKQNIKYNSLEKDNINERKSSNRKESKLIDSKDYKEFNNKLDEQIEKHIETVCEENILRKTYRTVKVKDKKTKKKVNKRVLVLFNVKENKEARTINAQIKKDNKVTYRTIPAIIGNYLRYDGYKVSAGVNKKRR